MVLAPMIFALSLVTPVIEMLVSVTDVISDQQFLELFFSISTQRWTYDFFHLRKARQAVLP